MIYNPHPDFNPKAIIGKRDDELEDSQSSKCLMALKQKVMETGKGVRQEIGFTRREGTRIYEYKNRDQICKNGPRQKKN